MFKSKLNSSHGSLLVEAIVVLGLIATFTPVLYKHVSERRNDIDNINHANTLLYLQQKTEEWLADPNNSTLNELSTTGSHKNINPSTISNTLTKFDNKYLIGIRREDVNGSPTYKALIVDKTNTGSDLRAGKVAELVGTSAGIYSAMDSANAWGVNGMWKESVTDYFTNKTDVPSGSVIVTTEYSRKKEQQRLSDMLIDVDLDMGNYDIKTEGNLDIGGNATIGGDATAKNITASETGKGKTLWATDKLCIGDSTADENCIKEWRDVLGDDLLVLQRCNNGSAKDCEIAFARKLNRVCIIDENGNGSEDNTLCGCSAVRAVYEEYLGSVPEPEVYNLTYDNGTAGNYGGFHKVICNVNELTFSNISTPKLSANVAETASDQYPGVVASYSVPGNGYYYIELRGEGGYNVGRARVGTANGGIIQANGKFYKGEILSFRGVKGGQDNNNQFGGAGSLLFRGIKANQKPILGAGGGTQWGNAGGGMLGGQGQRNDSRRNGYGWKGTSTQEKNKPTSASSTAGAKCCVNPQPLEGEEGTPWSCIYAEVGATGGGWITGVNGYPCFGNENYCLGWGLGGTGSTAQNCIDNGLTCNIRPGGNNNYSTNKTTGFKVYSQTNSANGNQGLGYASIRYCGPMSNDGLCQDMCASDSDCPKNILNSDPEAKYCERGFCDTSRFCTTNTDCQGVIGKANCVDGRCQERAKIGYTLQIPDPEIENDQRLIGMNYHNKIATLETRGITSAGKYVFELKGGTSTQSGGGSGYLKAEKTFSQTDVDNQTKLTLKIAGCVNEGYCNGIALGIQESSGNIAPTNADYVLVAGGEASSVGGSGWISGCGNTYSFSFKYGAKTDSSTCSKAWYAPDCTAWCSNIGSGCTDSSLCFECEEKTVDGKTYYKPKGYPDSFYGCVDDTATEPLIAQGGAYSHETTLRLYKGGTGLCNSEDGRITGYNCTWTNGGNFKANSSKAILYANKTNSGSSFVKIYYCGDENSTCPDPLP